MTSLHIVILNGEKLKSEEHPIVIRYTQNRKSNVISISKWLPEFWDTNKNLPKQKKPNYLEINTLVDEKKSFANKILMELEFLNQDFSFTEFGDWFKWNIYNKLLNRTFMLFFMKESGANVE